MSELSVGGGEDGKGKSGQETWVEKGTGGAGVGLWPWQWQWWWRLWLCRGMVGVDLVNGRGEVKGLPCVCGGRRRGAWWLLRVPSGDEGGWLTAFCSASGLCLPSACVSLASPSWAGLLGRPPCLWSDTGQGWGWLYHRLGAGRCHEGHGSKPYGHGAPTNDQRGGRGWEWQD